MFKRGYYNLALRALVFALVFCLTSGPILNAADPGSSSRGPRTVAETQFQYASDISSALRDRPSDARTFTEYRKALDAYGQVTRLNTDTHLSAESLVRMGELQREMADAANDSALYQQAITTFRRIVIEHPQSTFVGDALVSIAQVYEENLQDLDGAAAAYSELIDHFPSSVMAREARAVLARFDSQLRNRPVDVLVGAGVAKGAAILDDSQPRLTNVRNFTGPDYARVVIDLSSEAQYSGGRDGNRNLSIRLSDAVISDALYGRRFIVGESSLLKRITISAAGPVSAGAEIRIEVGALSDYSMFRLSEPERIVIDIHAATAAAKSGGRIEIDRRDASQVSEDVTAVTPSTAAKSEAAPRQSNGPKTGNAIFALPEITDPILPHNPAEATTAEVNGQGSGASLTVESKAAADAPIKCIVIDPGHGGHDTGTISGSGLREKDLVLDVARRLRSYIKSKYPGIEVVMTRESDRFIALEERTAIANSRHADLFISVHANASPSRIASGVETFFVSPDRAKEPREPGKTIAELLNPATEPAPAVADAAKPEPISASVRVGNRVAESRELARYIQAGLVRGIGAASPRTAANRGVKHASFAVLVGSAMPSVLAEISFISNPRDEALLQTTQFRERIAASLFAGLNGYLKKNLASETKQN
jgi:N-acetylmuramoyl-L-alanine amidase